MLETATDQVKVFLSGEAYKANIIFFAAMVFLVVSQTGFFGDTLGLQASVVTDIEGAAKGAIVGSLFAFFKRNN